MKTGFKQRKGNGTSLAELPAALFLLLICLCFPLLDLATISYRATFVDLACRGAGEKAGRSASFSQGSRLAKEYVAQIAQKFQGIDITKVELQIIETLKNDPAKVEVKQGPLAENKDPNTKLFEIQVTVDAKVQPLVTLSPGALGKIAGVTGPIEISAKAKNFVEAPNGLTR